MQSPLHGADIRLSDIGQILVAEWRMRPWWMQLIFLFCLYMTFIYSPFDLFFKPLEEDQDVWLGIMFTGWAAKVGGAVHWIVYALGAWGFWKMKSWMHPWAGIYIFQIAIAMALFGYFNTENNDVPLLFASIVFALFALLAVALWRGKRHFHSAS